MDTIRKKRVLVLGAAGMLGHAVFRFFSADNSFETFGTLRSGSKRRHFADFAADRILANVDVQNSDDLVSVFADVQPDIVINCIGIIKQLEASKNHLISLDINSSLPHRLAQLCRLGSARLIHPSTDCVFSGSQGMYAETDRPDADDLYGRTKLLGEVDYPHAITLRTSIIGHELDSANSLVDWFLSQTGPVKGFSKAVFSGLPTIEFARVIRDHVLPNESLRGLYHLSVDPINKFDLLKLVADVYGKRIEITPNDDLVIDRSLNSDRFRAATGYSPTPWPKLISRMHAHLASYGNTNV